MVHYTGPVQWAPPQQLRVQAVVALHRVGTGSRTRSSRHVAIRRQGLLLWQLFRLAESGAATAVGPASVWQRGDWIWL
ncbi:MAG: hypothetical protein WDW38_001805 [Sanguina aurantia]